MGLIFGRHINRIEELDATSSNAYRYPNKDGNYFASHFIMGGERFETSHPEAYLFGENVDLNFLGRKPTPFPYPAPQSNEPTRTLKSLINIRKESLRFVKSPDFSEAKKVVKDSISLNTSYNIEFIFDSDVRCGITIYYFCTEDIMPNGVIYTPRDASMNSESYHYKKGVNQQFTQVSHRFDPSKYCKDMLNYNFEDEIIPVLIQCIAEEGEEPRQQHMVFAVVEKNTDETYTLKPLKQKLFIDGLCYLLQEIYGIENKNVYQSKDVREEDVEDSGSECVICMSDSRDTLILPCRHLCLCYSCADSLRYQANNCPICRAPFRALIQIKAVQKSNNTLPHIGQNVDNQTSQDIPSGYEPVSLIEALNGPSAPLVPSYAPSSIPLFGNSPDIQHKHRDLNRKHSTSSSKLCENGDNEMPLIKVPGSTGGSSIAEVVVATMLSADQMPSNMESLSSAKCEVKKHQKGFRTSSAPENLRLLSSSMEIVDELGGANQNMEKVGELAETKSLLESSLVIEGTKIMPVSSPTPSQSCSRSSPFPLSTSQSLHLCEKSFKDASLVGEDSDYYTPEDPNITILVDQGTDTSLDTPQNVETCQMDESKVLEAEQCSYGKHEINQEKQTKGNFPTGGKVATDTFKKSENNVSDSIMLSEMHPLVVNLHTTKSMHT